METGNGYNNYMAKGKWKYWKGECQNVFWVSITCNNCKLNNVAKGNVEGLKIKKINGERKMRTELAKVNAKRKMAKGEVINTNSKRPFW